MAQGALRCVVFLVVAILRPARALGSCKDATPLAHRDHSLELKIPSIAG
jgi:hypothetical protein